MNVDDPNILLIIIKFWHWKNTKYLKLKKWIKWKSENSLAFEISENFEIHNVWNFINF